MRITFFGATKTVTGSKYLVETGGARVLVDCGLFQGYRKLRTRNWDHPGFDPASLTSVVLTHAHIDHSGYVPRLRTLGFSGRVFCTDGTRDLLDSGYLQEEDARRSNRYGYTRHHPAKPLYTRAEAEASLSSLEPVSYNQPFEVAPGISARFSRAGHILGSACLQLRSRRGLTLTFTGDVGRPNDPIMKPPSPLPAGDFLVTESTYGNRRHPEVDAVADIERIINETVSKGGVILVPAFAVGRAQHLLHIVAKLKQAGRIPDVPVFLDSPMAINATQIFCKHSEDHRISRDECHSMCSVAQYARTPEDSKAIDHLGGPRIVISASGMATGGRVLHHLRRFLPNKHGLRVGLEP